MTDHRRPYPLLVIVALFALMVTGCVSDVRPQSQAAKALIAAQAQATQEAMDYDSATQTAAQAQQRLDESYARATSQAQAALQAQIDQINTQAQIQQATHEADVNAVVLSQAQEQATLQAVSSRATVQAIGLEQQARYDGANATATAVARSVDNQKLYDDSTVIFTLVLKGGAVVVLVALGFTGVEVIRKRTTFHTVADMPFALSGGAFGSMTVIPLLPAPNENEEKNTRVHAYTTNTEYTPNNTAYTENNAIPVTYRGQVERYIPRLNSDERDAINKAKAKAIHILEEALAYNMAHQSDEDYNPAKINRHEKIGVDSTDRGEVCDMLEALNPAAISITQGGKPKDQGTFVTPQYGSSVEALLNSIKANDVRLYPKGFKSAAIDAAEEMNRHILSMPGVTR